MYDVRIFVIASQDKCLKPFTKEMIGYIKIVQVHYQNIFRENKMDNFVSNCDNNFFTLYALPLTSSIIKSIIFSEILKSILKLVSMLYIKIMDMEDLFRVLR